MAVKTPKVPGAARAKKPFFGKPSVAASKAPPKKPGLSGDKAETRKGPQFKR